MTDPDLNEAVAQAWLAFERHARERIALEIEARARVVGVKPDGPSWDDWWDGWRAGNADAAEVARGGES